MKKQTEFEKFDDTMRSLLKVSHTQIKDRLAEEKKTKQSKDQEKKV